MAGKLGAWGTLLLWGVLGADPLGFTQTGTPTIPATEAVALDGHTVSLPRDLGGRPAVLILGFGRHSAAAMTAWEKPVRTQVVPQGGVGFYEMAMLAEVPGFVRPFVVRRIGRAVPDFLKPHFLPLSDGEVAWKQTAAYTADQPEAAYVLLLDRGGRVQWSTHAQYTPEGFTELNRRARSLAAGGR